MVGSSGSLPAIQDMSSSEHPSVRSALLGPTTTVPASGSIEITNRGSPTATPSPLR